MRTCSDGKWWCTKAGNAPLPSPTNRQRAPTELKKSHPPALPKPVSRARLVKSSPTPYSNSGVSSSPTRIPIRPIRIQFIITLF